jgi:hypothetical protein
VIEALVAVPPRPHWTGLHGSLEQQNLILEKLTCELVMVVRVQQAEVVLEPPAAAKTSRI